MYALPLFTPFVGGFNIGHGGRDFIGRTAHAMAKRMCSQHEGSYRYRKIVDYYEIKIEKQLERDLVYRVRP